MAPAMNHGGRQAPDGRGSTLRVFPSLLDCPLSSDPAFRFTSRRTIDVLWAALATALWLSLTANIPLILAFWRAPDAGAGLGRIVFAMSGWAIGLALLVAFFAMMSLLLRGRAMKVLLILSVAIAAPVSYFGLFYGTRFDRAMFESVLATHSGEALELLGWRLILWCLVVGVLPAVWLWRTPLTEVRPWWRNLGAKTGLVAVCVAVIAVTVFPQYQRFASAARNKAIVFYDLSPLNVLAAAGGTVWRRFDTPTLRTPVGLDASSRYALAKPRIIVFVLGETARAQNFSWNGYERETTPRMRAVATTFFQDVASCGTVTATSVPCIFSGLTREAFSDRKARAQETLIDVIHRAGVRVIWRDNDGGCKGVCDAAEYVDLTDARDPRHCRTDERGECFDSILLEGLENTLSTSTRDTFVVLHLKGSHGPAYYKRYPKAFERFTPACQSNELSACTREQIVNAYDNTILYSDHIKGEVVAMLERLSDRYATAMLYASDHGESLGEHGLYLHGAPYAIAPKEQTRVPMLAWLSPKFLALEQWSESCVRNPPTTAVSHDNVYHTLLGLLDLETGVYRRELDLFAPCDTRSVVRAPGRSAPPPALPSIRTP